jgi:hypothetical protein
MILVRVVFQAKYAKAGEIVNILKQDPPRDEKYRLMTDLSGSFDTVVLETEIESLDAYFKGMWEMFADEEMSASMRKVSEMIESGHREFYTIEASS